MRLFYASKDNPGELEFSWAWLPHWVVFHGDVLDRVHKAAQQAIPPGVELKDLTNEHYDKLEAAAVDAIVKALPYVTGLQAYLEALRGVQMDPAKAPKAVFKKPSIPAPKA